jgi:hypothetical protein
LPEPLLRQAARLACQRHQSLSSIVAGFVEGRLRNAELGAQRVRAMEAFWKKAVAPVSKEERLMLEGIALIKR